jgi:hypothetical protein
MLVSGMEEVTEVREGGFFLAFANFFYNVTYLIAIISLYINGYRYAVLQDRGDTAINLNLNMRFIKMVLFILLFTLLIGIYAAIATGLVWGAHSLFSNIGIDVILGIILGIYAFYLMIRVSLFLIPISLDQGSPMKTSWRLMKGNVLRLFWLNVLVQLTVLLVTIVGGIGVAILGFLFGLVSVGLGWAVGIVLGLLLAIAMTLLAWAATAKAMGVVYMDLSGMTTKKKKS